MNLMVEYIQTKYVCNVCDAALIYEDYGDVKSTALYCKVCNSMPTLTKDGKKTDTSKLYTRL